MLQRRCATTATVLMGSCRCKQDSHRSTGPDHAVPLPAPDSHQHYEGIRERSKSAVRRAGIWTGFGRRFNATGLVTGHCPDFVCASHCTWRGARCEVTNRNSTTPTNPTPCCRPAPRGPTDLLPRSLSEQPQPPSTSRASLALVALSLPAGSEELRVVDC